MTPAGRSQRVQEARGEAPGARSMVLTMNTYSHVTPGMRQDAADVLFGERR